MRIKRNRAQIRNKHMIPSWKVLSFEIHEHFPSHRRRSSTGEEDRTVADSCMCCMISPLICWGGMTLLAIAHLLYFVDFVLIIGWSVVVHFDWTLIQFCPIIIKERVDRLICAFVTFFWIRDYMKKCHDDNEWNITIVCDSMDHFWWALAPQSLFTHPMFWAQTHDNISVVHLLIVDTPLTM